MAPRLQLSAAAVAALSRIQLVNTRFGLLTFEPSPPFRDLLAESRSQSRILIRAGNRVGKTAHVAWLIARRMVDEPGFRARVIGPTADHIHNILGQYLAEFLLPYVASDSYYVPGKGWNGGRARVIRLRNGSICELKSLMDNPDAHSGRSCHLVAFDEPPTMAHYLENAARLVDTAGCMIIAATMVNRSVDWLREMVQGKDDDPGPGRTMHGSGWLQFVCGFTRANCPWYTEEQRAAWMTTMAASPWQMAQRVEASWSGVTIERLFVGVTDANFRHDPPIGDLKIGIGIDHGEVVGHQAALLVAFQGTRLYVIDEYVNTIQTSPEDDAKEILALLTRHRIDPVSVDLAVGDLNTAKGYAGWRINEALEAALAAQTGSRSSPFHIQAPDKSPGSVHWGLRCINYGGRRGDLIIHPRCINLTKTLRHWKGKKTGEDGKLAHIADALRYIMTSAVGRSVIYARLRFD